MHWKCLNIDEGKSNVKAYSKLILGMVIVGDELWHKWHNGDRHDTWLSVCEWVNGWIMEWLSFYACLTHYSLVLHFYTPWKYQKTWGFFDIFRVYRKATPGCNVLIIKRRIYCWKSLKFIEGFFSWFVWYATLKLTFQSSNGRNGPPLHRPSLHRPSC